MASITLLSMALLLFSLHSTGAKAQIGVCNGMKGNDLPSSQQVVNLYKSNGIGLMRLYDPHPEALQALRGSGIQVLLGMPNDQLKVLAQSPSEATKWVQTNVVPFASFIRYIAVGNEVLVSKPFVVPAMQNIQNALNTANLGGRIKVSTAVSFGFIAANSFPPSSGEFGDLSFMGPVVDFLNRNRSPLLANVYPYFAYIGDDKDIHLDYALFTAPGTVVTDSQNGLKYQNLFDAMVDTVYAALDKAGGSNIPVVVSESGWPSYGGEGATLGNAGTYYKNLINHVKNGTPRKPRVSIETCLFAMFNENMKPGAEIERHFGLFFPETQKAKFGNINFNGK